MAVSSSASKDIYHYLHQEQLDLVGDFLLYLPPSKCRKRDLGNAVNVIPNSDDPFAKMFDDMSYVKSTDQSIEGAVIYESTPESNVNIEKYGLTQRIYVCYGKLKWIKAR